MSKHSMDRTPPRIELSPSRRPPAEAPSRTFSLFLAVSYILASLQFLRSYFIVDQPYLDALRYESGLERMPYQARILMALVMRQAAASTLIQRLAGKLRGPLHQPDILGLLLVDTLALILIAVVVRAFYRHLSPTGRFSALPYFLVLWMLSATYVVRFQEAIYFPYDLLAAALFTLCVYVSYRERYLLLIPAFLLACFNRETIVMIVPLLLLNLFVFPNGDRPKLQLRWEPIVTAAVLTLSWLVIYRHLNHLYAGNQTELGCRLRENLHFLANPQTWPQIASACGFLLPVPLILWRFIPQPRLRLYVLIIPAWVAIMFVVGLLPESRIFGELIGLVAVACTILFEQTCRSQASSTLTPS